MEPAKKRNLGRDVIVVRLEREGKTNDEEN